VMVAGGAGRLLRLLLSYGVARHHINFTSFFVVLMACVNAGSALCVLME